MKALIRLSTPVFYLFVIIGLIACEQSDFKEGNKNSGLSQEPYSDAFSRKAETAAAPLPLKQLACSEGLQRANASGKTDFKELFEIVCKGKQPNARFDQLISSPYNGIGDPVVETVLNEPSNEVTRMLFAFSVAIKNPNPANVGAQTIQEYFGDGINEGNSELTIDIENKVNFPGGGSSRTIVLNYDLINANGAGIFDQRRTEVNNYLLDERVHDITLTTEYLLDASENPFYASSKSIAFTMQNEKGDGSIIVFISEMTMLNRIDPERMIVTMRDLNIGSARVLAQELNGAPSTEAPATENIPEEDD